MLSPLTHWQFLLCHLHVTHSMYVMLFRFMIMTITMTMTSSTILMLFELHAEVQAVQDAHAEAC